MVRKKKSGMVNALIFANAILAVIIGGIIWMLVSKNGAKNAALETTTPSSMQAASSQANDSVSNEDEMKLQALQRQVEIEKQKSLQAQEAERKKAAELAKQLEDEKRRAESEIIAARKQAADERAKLEAQLAAQQQAQEKQALVDKNREEKLSNSQLTALQNQLEQAQTDAETVRAKLREEQELTKLTIAKAQRAAELKLAEERERLDKLEAANQEAKKQAEELAEKLKSTESQAQQVAENQAKADQENKRLIEQLRTQMELQTQAAASSGSENQPDNQQFVSASSDNNAQQLVEAVKSALAQASQDDQDYIQALSGNVKPFIKTESQKNALKKAGTEEVDYFNRVVAGAQSTTGSTVGTTSGANSDTTSAITSEVEQLLKDRIKNKEQKQLEKDIAYIESLNPEAQQRSSESRFITVKSGDTLSNIADRAYGDWRLYRRIFEANPQIISNPNLIFPGQVLRVPF